MHILAQILAPLCQVLHPTCHHSRSLHLKFSESLIAVMFSKLDLCTQNTILSHSKTKKLKCRVLFSTQMSQHFSAPFGIPSKTFLHFKLISPFSHYIQIKEHSTHLCTGCFDVIFLITYSVRRHKNQAKKSFVHFHSNETKF